MKPKSQGIAAPNPGLAGRAVGATFPEFTTGSWRWNRAKVTIRAACGDGNPRRLFCGIVPPGTRTVLGPTVRRPPTHSLRLISDTLCKIETIVQATLKAVVYRQQRWVAWHLALVAYGAVSSRWRMRAGFHGRISWRRPAPGAKPRTTRASLPPHRGRSPHLSPLGMHSPPAAIAVARFAESRCRRIDGN